MACDPIPFVPVVPHLAVSAYNTDMCAASGNPTCAAAPPPPPGLTVAEYFRDVEGQDVLLFVDNIFRFTQVRGWVGGWMAAVGCCHSN